MASFLIVDDDPKILMFLSELVESQGHACDQALTLKQGLGLCLENPYDIVLLDLEFPDGNALEVLPDMIRSPSSPEVIIITGTGGVSGAKLAFKYGAWDFIQKPFIMEEVFLPVSRALEYRKSKQQPPLVQLKREKIIGDSAVIQNCLDTVAKASATRVSVLISGETGTGKELFARAIHDNSQRASGQFIPINCGAIPESLAESTFFGHCKGAFTGADTERQGVVCQADQGTLFLDEIGELPLNAQIALLRVLQEKTVRPIGAKKEIPVDFRLVSATNQDLEQMVRQGRFRQDLLFRIRSMAIELPPLRDRGDDLEKIALHQVHRACRENHIEMKGISPDFISVLISNPWPGNVRELVSALEAAVAASCIDPMLYPKHLPPEYRAAALDIRPGESAGQAPADLSGIQGDDRGAFPTLPRYRQNTERQYLEAVIRRVRGDRKKACTLSGISQARFYELLKKHGLSLSRTSTGPGPST